MIDSALYTQLVNLGALGVSLFFIKKWINQIDVDRTHQDQRITDQDLKIESIKLQNQNHSKSLCDKITAVQIRQQQCRETLSGRFTDKTESALLFSDIYNDLKVLNKEVYSIVGKRAGDHE